MIVNVNRVNFILNFERNMSLKSYKSIFYTSVDLCLKHKVVVGF